MLKSDMLNILNALKRLQLTSKTDALHIIVPKTLATSVNA